MEELKLSVMIAVFEEMFGFWLWWGLVILAVSITVLFFYIMIRDKRFYPRHYLWAQIAAPFGAIGAVVLVLVVTNSNLGDLVTPLDVIVILGVAGLGAAGAVIWAYVAQAFIERRCAAK